MTLQRRITNWFFMLCCVLGFPGNTIIGQTTYQDLEFPPLTFTPPQVERHTLENGMRVFFVEDHELPVISIYALIKTGSIYEPQEKIGLATITAEVIRTGGTITRSADDINDTLEFLASSVEVDIEDELGSIELWTLKKNFTTSLEIFADIMMHPAFDQDKLDLSKAHTLEVIRRRNDTPDSIVGREFMRLVYGPMHPLARIPEIDTINTIMRDDLVDFHQQYFHPNNLMLAVTGDFDANEMLSMLQTAFEDWEPAEMNFTDVETVEYELAPSVNLIHKDVDQTNFMLGHLGIKADNPDYPAITLLDSILGSGGFSNRLYQRVRNDLGLAYTVGSYLGAGTRDYGTFLVFGGTRNETVEQTLGVILDEIRDLREYEVSAEELQAAKNQYINSFVFKFATVNDIIRRQMFYEYFDYPSDFLEQFRDRVMQVTAADILRVAQTYLHPQQMVILAVGNAEEIREALASFGEVRMISLDDTPEEISQ